MTSWGEIGSVVLEKKLKITHRREKGTRATGDHFFSNQVSYEGHNGSPKHGAKWIWLLNDRCTF